MQPERVLSDKEIKSNLETGTTHVERLPTSEIPDFVGEDVSYGPGGFRGIIASPFVCGAAFLASLGGFSFGLVIRILSPFIR